MLWIGDVLVEDRLIDLRLICDVRACRGLCCVAGEAGAPLRSREARQLRRLWPRLLRFLPEGSPEDVRSGPVARRAGRAEVALCGPAGPCIFVIREAGAARCALEHARTAGIDVRRPLSCRLFPLRLRAHGETQHLVLGAGEECRPCLGGRGVHRQVREALVELFGTRWYAELDRALGEARRDRAARHGSRSGLA